MNGIAVGPFELKIKSSILTRRGGCVAGLPRVPDSYAARSAFLPFGPISFGKSLDLFDRVSVITKIRGWDEKFIFLEQRFERNKETVAGGIVKSCILNKNGPIPTHVVLSELMHDKKSPELSTWIKDWAKARKPLLMRE